MPSYNITIDDTSPAWKYVGQWNNDNPHDDQYVNYYGKTFHATPVSGSSVTMPFNGTAITVYGARRSNHDLYQANVDGVSSSGSLPTGYSADNIFQSPLFTAGDLDPRKEHTVYLSDASVDTDRPWFDIDFAEVTLGDGDPSTSSSDITLDDYSANITYSNGWNEGGSSSLAPQYFNSSFHVTGVTGATATITFWGNAIQIIGAISNNHGPFTLSLDGAADIKLTGTAYQFQPQTLLYQFSGLSAGPHTLVLTHTSTNSSEYTDLDKIVVSRWDGSFSASSTTSSSSAASASASSNDQNNQNHSSNKLSTGAIVGIAIGAVVLVGLLALLVFLLRRRGQGARRRKSVRGPKPTDLMAEPDLVAPVSLPIPRHPTPPASPAPPTSSVNATLLSPSGLSTQLPHSLPDGAVPPQYAEIVNYDQGNSSASSSSAAAAAAAMAGKRRLANP